MRVAIRTPETIQACGEIITLENKLKEVLQAVAISVYTRIHMAEKMKQVAVRMKPHMHAEVVKLSKRCKQGFGEFVRSAVNIHLEFVRGLRKTK